MKVKWRKWIFVATIATSMLYACNEDEGENKVPTPLSPSDERVVVDTMECDNSVIEGIGAEGATISFVTTTNKTFFVTSPNEWITIENPEGRALTANYTIIAVIDQNEGEAREGIIRVTFDDTKTTTINIVVMQNGAEEVIIEAPVVDYAYTQQFEKSNYATSTTSWKLKDKIDLAEKLGVTDWESAVANGELLVQGYLVDNSLTGNVKENYTSRCGFFFDENGYVTTPGGNPNPSRMAVEFDTTTYLSGKFSSMPMNVELGGTYKMMWAYTYGDRIATVEYTIEVVEKVVFTPEVKYTIEISQELNTNYDGVSWTVEEKKDEIAATLRVEDWSAAVADGTVQYKTFKSDGTLSDNYTSNSGYWVNAEGYVTNWAAGSVVCTEEMSSDYLSGYGLQFPGATVEGQTYIMYVIYWNSVLDLQYVVKINYNITEKAPDPVYEVVKSYSIDGWELSSSKWYDQGVEYNITDIAPSFPDEIGGEVDLINMHYTKSNGDISYQSWTVTDGWFGNEGAEYFGAESSVCLKPYADGTMWLGTKGDVAVPGDTPEIILQYANKSTMKCVEVKVKITIVE